MRIPGQKEDLPFYQHITNGHIDQSSNQLSDSHGPQSDASNTGITFAPGLTRDPNPYFPNRSILRQPGSYSSTARNRGESITSMSRRVDFSLGLKDVDSADLIGDVHTNTSPVRLPEYRNHGSRSRSRRRPSIPEEATDDSQTLDRSMSQASHGHLVNRTSTELSNRPRKSHSIVHRNRFFSRRNQKDDKRGEYDDLMEQGMADIPESSAHPDRLDPRTGIISRQAIRLNSGLNDDPVEPVVPPASKQDKPPTRRAMEEIELHTMG